uniref:Golgin B1 n=1 Tax=Jaculus jaculus TaxID=51337 RepID=A0A8C5P0T3_JACJA
MLSRLSGLANVVLHELSGDDTDQNMTAPLATVSSPVLIPTRKTREECKVEGCEQPALCQAECGLRKHSAEEEMEMIKHELQEKEKLISSLQAQLTQAQPEQAAQLDNSCAEREELAVVRQQLREKEELISALQTQLSQTQAEQAAQKLKVLQRRLEEHEEALLGRTQVVDLLQQELMAAEHRNQVLSQQVQQLEAEHNTLRDTVEAERQESKAQMEKMEVEVAERKFAFHKLQEEMHQVLGQVERASRAQAELESQCSALEQKHRAEMEEKTAHILSLQKTEEELRSACDALKDENSKLLQEQKEQAVQSAQAIQQLEDQLQQKSKEISEFLNKPTLQKHETASQTSLPDVYSEGTQAVMEENVASLQRRVVELENEKGALLLSSIELEELKAENEKLSSRIALLEAQDRPGETAIEVREISTADTAVFIKSSSSTEERGQDVLENAFSQKHKELSVLLVEMKEAQEEIAFLQSQLQGKRPEGDFEVFDQKEMKLVETGEGPSDSVEGAPLLPGEGDRAPAVAIGGLDQEHSERQHGAAENSGTELPSAEPGRVGQPPSTSDPCQCHQDELERLKGQILDLETNFSKAEEVYKKHLDEKAKEVGSLTQLTEALTKSEEDSRGALAALSEERDQLLSRLEDLDVLADLRAQVKELESQLAEAEQRRHLDYESQRTQHTLLAEQLHSLGIEAKSKDVKIEALQRELDDAHLQCSEQGVLTKSLQSQLQSKESEVLEGAERVRDISNKMEELSQALSQKDLELAKMDQLLLEKKKDVESLLQTIQEKDQQVTELSFSMTEKMVQLNEEKFSLGVEVKTLKEQLNLLSRAEEAKKEQAEGSDAVSGPKQHHDEVSPDLERELDHLKKESEQRKRKLQAALINRKELLQRVSALEEELAHARDDSKKEAPAHDSDSRKMEDGKESKGDSEKCVTSKCQAIEMSLKQTISERELELEHVRKDLKEKMVAEERLQTVVQQMHQNLQDKTHQIDLLQAEITENQAVIQKFAMAAKDAGDGDSAAPFRETMSSSPADSGSGDPLKPELEDKILDLEKEKEQLQKKLQEALASRKVILKKAQEKERHLKEELKQQKEDYNRLQEQFDEQSKENQGIGEQLRQLQMQVRGSMDRKLSGPDLRAAGSPAQGTEECPAPPVLESDLCQSCPPRPGGIDTGQVNTLVAQIKAQLKEIEAEKEELELKVHSTTSELTKKSAEVFQLQEQVSQQGFEIQNLKAAAHEAETRAESLKQTLESSQLRLADLEHLRTLQAELDELQKHIGLKEEEVSYLSAQLSEKEETLTRVQAETAEQEDLIKALNTQLEMQGKAHEDKIRQFQAELAELKQRPEESAEGGRAKQQLQRKLQAALISRKEALRENKTLQEEVSVAKDTIERLTKALADVESQASAQTQEKDALLERLAVLQEERDKLITEMDRSLLENQNLSGSCESLKLALEGLTKDKESLVKELESLRVCKAAESSEWQEKHKEMQKEYEILLQSYENVSDEAERIQHVVESVRQEKQELYGKLRNSEASKKETEKQLQDTEQEMEEMKEKMRKFAKSKQQKILELEEENDRLRAEAHPAGGPAKDRIEELLSSNASVKEELERVQSEYKVLSKEFESLKAEKDILSEEVLDLKHQVEENISKQASPGATEKPDNLEDITEEATQPVPLACPGQASESVNAKLEDPATVRSQDGTQPGLGENLSSQDDINNYLQQLDQLKERIAELEREKQKDTELSQSLEKEKGALLSQISAKDRELKTLQEESAQMNLLNQQTQEELLRVTKLKEAVEEEKDELEERLMNQLAELNGSIGNYYQDVTDAQIKNELLESEMQNLKKCVSELEEEKQQLVKEKTQVELEIRKEYMEKIQGAQKGAGSKSHTEELQELLKEKQQEVKQLQKDCIRYQEKISALERTVKALEFVQTESQKDLDVTKENLAKAVEHRKNAQAELRHFKVLLDDTQSEAARVLTDNLKLKKELQSHKESMKSQMKQKAEDLERRLERAEEAHLEEKKSTQEKLDALQREKAHVEGALGEIQVALNRKDQEVKQLQDNLDSTVAQLAAFTKSMSSLQDDRDRVIDEAKKWEKKFGDAIQSKEEEIRLKEENCSVLKDQVRQMSIHIEELKITVSRLEHDKQIWESKTQTEVQHQQKVCETLQGENKELLSQLEDARQLYCNSQNELVKLESELKSLKEQSADVNSSLEKCKEHKETLEAIVKQQEADMQNYKFSYEQLQADLTASRELTSKLHEEINIKEQKILHLLSGKEDVIQEAVTKLNQRHEKEIQELENLLTQEEEDNIVLEEENKKAVDKTNQLIEIIKSIKKENSQQKAQLDSFVKSMSSLQGDRDRIVSDYRQLEERHLSVILEKDQLIQDAAAENNRLKGELRALRSHMDDLNSENAKLDAELIQYREDLNQVMAIKDRQQKQLLDAQLQQNEELRQECAQLRQKLQGCEEAREGLRRSADALLEEKRGLSQETESLRAQVTALQEEGTVGMYHAQLKVEEEEVQRVSAALSSSQKRITELEEELACVRKEATRKVGEIEAKLKKELKHLHHDAGIMRNETETAEERVAELARDLVEMEQKLLVVTKENKDLTAQIQAFGRSMSSLQDSRDRANEELNELRRKYDASVRELAQVRGAQDPFGTESEALSHAALPLNTAESSLSRLEKLNQQLISKDEQLLHLSSQLEDSHNQVQSFSKAMASLQNERDHLWSELEKSRKWEEGKQRAAAQPASSPAEVQSLKRAMSSLQNDRDRLLKELKNLQQQYLQINQEVTELRPLKAQLQEYQDKAKTFQIMQEELRQENLSWQRELHQLRMEKSSWALQERSMKEQYLMAISDKDQQLSHLQNVMRELRPSSSQTQTLRAPSQRQVSPETSDSLDGSQSLVYEMELLRTQLNDSLKEIHQKELRIQQLNSKFSQLLEEKNTLSIQLCDTSQSLRENQQHYSELFNHCAVLEKQVQELQTGPLSLDVAPGAPQEKNGVHRKSDAEAVRESQQSVSDAQQQLCSSQQEVSELKKLLEEERDQRAAAESALSVAEEQIRRLEHSEWDSSRTPIMGACGSQEQVLLMDVEGNSCRRTRSGAGWKRVLRSLCHSRTRVPLLATMYLLMVHVLLILCFAGHL